jgi:probable HAF family extracellular repeat protein
MGCSLRRAVKPLDVIFGLSFGVMLALVGCSHDTPLEPEERPAAFSATAVGNITDLGTLGGERAAAAGINSNGDIVGTITEGGLRHGFLWRSSGTATHINRTTAEDVNTARKVVGGIDAYSWQNGSVTELPALSTDPDCSFTWAFAVNTSGQVVGQSENSACSTRPVIWENGTVRNLGDLGAGFGRARDINDNGQIVGYSSPHAFLWENGSMRSLGTLGGDFSEAFGINSAGQVVGASNLTEGSSEVHALLWANGNMTDLGTLGGSTSYALDINDNAQVVGYSTIANGRTHAFWWQDGIMSDLGTLGGDRMVANAINNSGQVAGESNLTPRGPAHAVRWTIPTDNFWSVRAPLSAVRRGHSVGSANGLLYVIGGENNFGNVISTVQAYDPGTNQWSAKAPLPVGRQSANGAATINSIIYVAGGLNPAGKLTSTLYAYNPATNRWLGQRNLPEPGGCGGSAVIGGKLYSFSGCRLVNGVQDAAGLLHRYDPAANSWTTLPSAPSVHFQPAVAAVGEKLYVVGGNNGAGVATRRVDVYDPATDSWATKAPMPTGRVALAGAAVGGKLYVMGGRSGTSYKDAVQVYDPVTNSWSSGAPMITARAGFGAAAIGQFIYAVGGRNSNKLFTVNERYTP